MLVFVKTLQGTTYQIDVDASDTIEVCKHKIRDIIGVPEDEQRLIFAGLCVRSDVLIMSRKTVGRRENVC